MATRNGMVSFRLRDANGAKASAPFNVIVDDSQTLLVQLNDVQNFAAALDAITGAVIEEVVYSVSYVPTAVKTDPDANVDITQTATFNFSQANGNPYQTPQVVPAIKDTLVVGGAIDLTDTDVQAFVTFLKNGHTALRVVSKALNALVDLLDALFSFRKRTSAIARRSFPS